MGKRRKYAARAMRVRIARERRRHRRYSLAAEVKGSLLSNIGIPLKGQETLKGRVRDVSAGGLCVLSSRPVGASNVVRCELGLPSVPVRIPALMQVRWARETPSKGKYHIGLQFLI